MSTVLIQPRGYVGHDDDKLSGPIDRAGVPYVFADNPGDAREILEHGFVAGFTQSWRTPTTAEAASDMNSVTSLVLEFDTAANARAVLTHFRASNAADGYDLFTVPRELADGYGAQKGPDASGLFVGVAWARDAYLFDIMLTTTGTSATRQQVITLAQQQNR